MARLGEHIYWQMPGEDLHETLGDGPGGGIADGRRLMHVLNLYAPRDGNGLGPVQDATLQSVETARSFAHAAPRRVDVDLVSVQRPEDGSLVPEAFAYRADLERDVTDVHEFAVKLPLPILFDVLARANTCASPAEHVVWTNSDICLAPNFYATVAALLDLGYDALIINRRTVHGFTPDANPLIAMAETGEDHPGLDCFVFPRTWIDRFVTNTACIGAGFVMRGLLLNLASLADALLALTRVHLTWHYGDDRPWAGPDMAEFETHNRRQTEAVSRRLMEDPDRAARLSVLFEHLPKYRVEPSG